jgi:WD40 repeat protein
MTKVFISYSHADTTIARKIVDALKSHELDSWVDWEDIPPTAEWMEQIHKGIEEADAFIILLSPSSVFSPYCQQETEHAAKNNKRLLPVVVGDFDPKDISPILAKLNWLFFRPTDDFDASLAKLFDAIHTDLGWAETHRRLQVRALEWERLQNKSLLLRGKDLRKTEEALAASGQKDPQPTDLQRQYLLASRRNDSQGRSLVGLIAMTITVVLGIVTIAALVLDLNASATKNQSLTAIANSKATQSAANLSLATAAVEIHQAQVGKLIAESELSKGTSPNESLLLALEAARLNEEAEEPISRNIFRHDIFQALRDALVANSNQSGSNFGSDPIFLKDTETLEISIQNNTLMAQASFIAGQTNTNSKFLPLYLYTLSLPDPSNPILYSPERESIRSATLSSDGKWLVYHGSDQADLVNLSGNEAPKVIPLPGLKLSQDTSKNLDVAFDFSPDGNWLSIYLPDSRVYLADISATPKSNLISPPTSNGGGATREIISPDSHWLAIQFDKDNPVVYLFDLNDANPARSKFIQNRLRLLALSNNWITVQDSDDNNIYLIDPANPEVKEQWVGLGKTAEAGIEGSKATEIRRSNTSKREIAISNGGSDSLLLKAVGFSPNGNWLVMSTCFGQPGWSYPTYEPTMAVFCQNSTKAFFTLWNISETNPSKTDIPAQGDVTFTFSPNNRWLVLSDSAGNVSLRDLSYTGKEVASFTSLATGQRMPAVAFSLDEHWLAVLDGSGKIHVLDLSNGNPDSMEFTPVLQTESIQAIAFSHDGGWLAAVTGSGDILLWETTSYSTTTIPYILRGSGYNEIVFSEDDRWLVASGPSVEAALWHMKTDELFELICQTVERNITDAEWAKHGFIQDCSTTITNWPVVP